MEETEDERASERRNSRINIDVNVSDVEIASILSQEESEDASIFF